MLVFNKVLYEDASSQVRVVYDDMISTMSLDSPDQIPNWALYVAHEPDSLKNKWNLIKDCIFNNPMSPILRELLMVCISRNTGSPYCEARHAYEVMQITNLSYAEIVDIIEGHSQGLVPEKYIGAIEVAKAIIYSDCQDSAKHIAHLGEYGFSSNEAVQFIEFMTAGMYISFFNKCLNTPMDEHVKSYLEDSGIFCNYSANNPTSQQYTIDS